MVQTNPFLIEGYLSPDYFCDRVEETSLLTRHITNRCNVALIAPRRLGKSGLIYHCFQQKEICEQYHCVYIDIYDSKNLNEFVYALGKGILTTLKPKGRKVWEFFLNILQSLKSTISFDINGNPEWSVGIGESARRHRPGRETQVDYVARIPAKVSFGVQHSTGGGQGFARQGFHHAG